MMMVCCEDVDDYGGDGVLMCQKLTPTTLNVSLSESQRGITFLAQKLE